ncbi:acyl-CoA carboxylase subunit epsilon [Amycolatopsis sp. K13G38]|uniref:Acyl-CoA carboxylase subunit epsilon n=1 Tax=Amycolatopsis acididurans TaxID=2724524 RepID=A0ABX1JER7_9PSEU|nr:acyl-CoA carboxylase subunit epsilon [Amycolatopsis acididurans]NKQ58275.1 acyl-CoA carboxylase subunit epsilon [Amycolatopsis acididurans]
MSDEKRPFLRIVRGNPDDEELAALTAVLAAAASAPAEPERPRRRSAWADRAHQLRMPLHPGEGAWRASALPR